VGPHRDSEARSLERPAWFLLLPHQQPSSWRHLQLGVGRAKMPDHQRSRCQSRNCKLSACVLRFATLRMWDYWYAEAAILS
jgi:hypothetical protein